MAGRRAHLLPGKQMKAMSPSGRTVAMQFNGDMLEIVADGKRTSLVPTGPTDWVELPNDTVVVAMSTRQFIHASATAPTSKQRNSASPW